MILDNFRSETSFISNISSQIFKILILGFVNVGLVSFSIYRFLEGPGMEGLHVFLSPPDPFSIYNVLEAFLIVLIFQSAFPFILLLLWIAIEGFTSSTIEYGKTISVYLKLCWFLGFLLFGLLLIGRLLSLI